MKNRIPRNFNQIIIEMLQNTNFTKTKDVLHVYKNEHGYLALNTTSNKYYYVFPSMLRDATICKIITIN